MLKLNSLPQLHASFLNQVSLPVLKGIVRGIEIGYQSSWNDCLERYCNEAQYQNWWYHRWMAVDAELMCVGERFKQSSNWVSNTDKTIMSHTELTVGDFLLTQSCMASDYRKPKYAKYRELLAQSNRFPLFEEASPAYEQGQTIWGVIQHKPDIDLHRPASIKIAFYDKDFNHAVEPINLRHAIASAEEVVPNIVVLPKIKIKTPTA